MTKLLRGHSRGFGERKIKEMGLQTFPRNSHCADVTLCGRVLHSLEAVTGARSPMVEIERLVRRASTRTTSEFPWSWRDDVGCSSGNKMGCLSKRDANINDALAHML